MTQKKFTSDIDIDVADRDAVLKLIAHTPASQWRENQLVKHNTGVYVTAVPQESVQGFASFDYQSSEQLGYVKLVIINNGVYQMVRDHAHLDQLLATEPQWSKLDQRDFFNQVVHIGNHWDLYRRLREPLNSIPRMAMFLAMIRPAKRDLVTKKWAEIAQSVWVKPTDGSYFFKKSHSLSYALLVQIHMNLLCEQDH